MVVEEYDAQFVASHSSRVPEIAVSRPRVHRAIKLSIKAVWLRAIIGYTSQLSPYIAVSTTSFRPADRT